MRVLTHPQFVGAIFGLLLTVGSSSAQTYTWTTGASGNWNSAGWTLSGTSGVGPPPAGADATISVGSSAYTVSVTDSQSINNLTLSNSNATLATGGSLTVNGTFTLHSGIIDNTGNGLTLNGALTWNGGTVGGGTVTASNGGTLTGGTMSGATANLASGAFAWNSGDLTFTAGQLIVGSNATVTLAQNSNFGPTSGSTGIIQNNGTIQKTGGAGTSQLHSGITLNNAGIFRVTDGTWGIETGSTVNNTGIIDIGSASTFFVNGGSVNLNSGSAITGTGLVEVNLTGGTLSVNATVNEAGTLSYVRGLINGSGTLNIAGAFNFGMFDSNSLTGLTVNAGGGGNWTGSATARIGTATVNLSGGTTTWNGNDIVFTAGGTLNVANGAILNLTDDHGFSVTAGSPTVTVNGTLEKTSGNSNSTIPATVAFSIGSTGLLDIESGNIILQPSATNNGTIKVGTGSLELNTASTMSGSGTLNITASGTLSVKPGTGAIAAISSGTFTNSGTVSVTSGTFQISNAGVFVTNYSTATSTLTGGTWLITNSTLDFNGRVIGTIASGTTIELSGTSAAMTGLTGLTQNNGQLRIYNGATLNPTATVNNAGMMEVSGTLGSSLNVQSGGVLAGKGTVSGTVTVQNGGTVAPGPGPYAANGTAMLTVGNLTLNSGANYAWELNSWAASTGAGSNFDQIRGASGAKLDLSSVSNANPIVLSIVGLTSSSAPGLITGFDGTQTRSWVIANFSNGNSSGGIIGFSPDKFKLDTSNFANAQNTSAFSLSVDANSNNLILTFTPVPEPGAVLCIAGVMGMAGLGIRRMRTASVS
jgi:fibronectin-binding autotransporter adhesin